MRLSAATNRTARTPPPPPPHTHHTHTLSHHTHACPQERMAFLQADLMHLFDDQGVDQSQ
jgi:hypothetical protein